MTAMPEMAAAQSEDVRTYDIPAQDLAGALKAFAVASGREVIAPSETLEGKRSAPVVGQLAPDQAVARLLAGTGLSFTLVDGAFVIRPILAAAADVSSATAEAEILVTGTRIRGAPVASPVIAIGEDDIRAQGLSDLGEVARRIPQSFGGGQNPGIGANVPTASGGDVGGGSSLNLRGLGSDATLTLLNGHRLAYTAALQSVDVSAIPLAAIERVEVVPDGASAIYGSDAVAGVANIILRKRYSGLETGVRLATSTDGGGFQQRYDALAGATWSSGGVWAAYEYGSNSAIRAHDRSYASSRSPGLDLFPALRHHSVVASGRKDLAGDLSLSIDGLYNIRWSDSVMPTLPSGDLNAGRATFHSIDKSYGLAPSLELSLPANWRLALTGTYGMERVDFHQVQCAGADCSDAGWNYYRNTARSVEVSGSGHVVELPGGMSKVAIGAGYREIGFDRFSAALGAAINSVSRQDSYFAYGEVSLPLVGSEQGLRFVHRFDLDVAVRYERYPGIGGVVTPKVGAAWAITPDVSMKGSWGQSFRAPTLFQQYQPRTAVLYPSALLGASGSSPTSGAILLVGGNPALEPERATTWSATVDLQPRAAPGLAFAVGYFHIAYRDRIVSPITLLSQSLSNPSYRDQVILNPNSAEQAAALASTGSFINYTGVSYDPANIIAVVDNAYVNAGRQTAHGIDVLASYATSIGPGQQLTFSANVAYLKSEQQLAAGQPVEPLAGTIFNPPHWRGQGSASWSGGPLTLTAALSYIGGVRDTRFSPARGIDGMTMLDLTARYRVEGTGSPLEGTEFALSVQNLLNDKPDPISVGAPYQTPYDSTNYSPIGRLLAIEVRKKW
ncbi:hypothetical protein GCM10011515_00260 [Tsuneonella deserti]|uniref:Secretin/TonB short N-terminal domain-containing protein n=2 Tax=Tsuneonella deserti TaxID=2035528 RepID=A0ABQ1RXM6_9SPHN|nr:hypothetical protein GCM10011515_00260 [Tsuneonella deserti]